MLLGILPETSSSVLLGSASARLPDSTYKFDCNTRLKTTRTHSKASRSPSRLSSASALSLWKKADGIATNLSESCGCSSQGRCRTHCKHVRQQFQTSLLKNTGSIDRPATGTLTAPRACLRVRNNDNPILRSSLSRKNSSGALDLPATRSGFGSKSRSADSFQ